MKRLPPLTLSTLLLSGSLFAEGSVWDRPVGAYEGPLEITVYRSPSCGCCGGWIDHLKKQGFEVTDVKTDKLGEIKHQHGVPGAAASCHTAIIDGYVVEGHVPAGDIINLLNSRPQITGIAVPAMPTGGPGMEDGDRKDPFSVVAFDRAGNMELFNHYANY